uniref:U-box domain-containing protein n=1 Tax=Cicer arietinum TaxID=3827 RepID=A0A3Q7YCL7_CICAR|nr:U-box domain-containing protein 21-like [Cicer arietinum]
MKNRKLLSSIISLLSPSYSKTPQFSIIDFSPLIHPPLLIVFQQMHPVSEQSRLILGSLNSLSCMVWFLNDKNQVSTRQNASLLIKEMHVESLMKIEGIVETLVNMVKVPIGSVSTKACLSTIFHLVFSSKSKKVVFERFVELGLVSILLEIIVDAEKGVCEKSLGVLDCLCDSKNGVGIAKSNALTLLLVIKKLLRVSELSSSFVVSIVYKICCDNKGEEEGVLIEAI